MTVDPIVLNRFRLGPVLAIVIWAIGGAGSFAQTAEPLPAEPRDAQSYFGRGKDQVVSQRWEQAIADFTRAIELKPDYWEAYMNRASSYLLLAKYDLAAADYTNVIHKQPSSEQAYTGRAFVYSITGRPELCVADLNEAIHLAPKDASAYRLRAKCKDAGDDANGASADRAKADQIEAEAAPPAPPVTLPINQ